MVKPSIARSHPRPTTTPTCLFPRCSVQTDAPWRVFRHVKRNGSRTSGPNPGSDGCVTESLPELGGLGGAMRLETVKSVLMQP